MVDTPRGQAASMTPVDFGSQYAQTINVRYAASQGILRGTGADWFGPLNPQAPSAPPEVAGRAWNFISGFNLQTRPRGFEVVNFATMRALADSYDLLRLVIETRKDQVTKTRWKIRAKADNNPNTLDQGATPEQQTRIDYLTTFFERPDGVQKWRPWLRSLLEDTFVIDAATLYKRRNRGGILTALEQMDGATIKVVIDDWGRTPQPYLVGSEILYPPAFQQILYGVPAVNYSTRDVLYRPFNKRVHKAYGYSAVEQIITTVNIAMRRQQFQLGYYTEGNVPEALIGTPDGWCYSEDTEVLTRDGWKLFTAVDILKDEFATRSTDGVFEWQKANGINITPFDGEMVALKSRTIDCLVNPPHRVLIATKRKDGSWAEKIMLAGDLLQQHHDGERIPVTSAWGGGKEVGTQIFAQTTRRGGGIDLVMTGDQYCAFMGAWLAEGSVNDRSAMLTQRPTGKAYWAYRGLLSDILGKEPSYLRDSFTVSNAPLARWLRQFSTATKKKVPSDILNASMRQIEIFLHYYALGDGSADGRRIYTSSKVMADQLQELVQKTGRSATISIDDRRGREISSGGRAISTRNINYVVHISESSVRRFSVSGERYVGTVGCVSVPNGILYVRRNGKACWSGNTPEQIVAFQNAWDAMFTGNLAQRRHAKFVPGGVAKTFVPTKEPDLKNPMDDWLARLVCFAFSISPQQLVTMMNRATAQQSSEQSKEEGLEPLKDYIKEIVDDVIETEFNSPDLEMAWDDEIVVDEKTQAEIISEKVGNGLITVNRGREMMGEEPSEDPGANSLMIKTATGYVPIGANTVDGKKEAIAAGIVPDPTAVPEKPFGGPPAAGKKPTPAKKPAPPPAEKVQKLVMARNLMGVFKASGVPEPVPFPFPPAKKSASRV